jgi:F-type H+-transporting ATPase subunit epsilon
MANKVNLKLVTPERVVFEDAFDSVALETDLGQITIMPHHAPLVAKLMPGEMVVKNGGQENYLHVAGGFVTVEAGSQVILLADAAEHDYEIDEQRAREARERAQKALRESSVSAEEVAAAEAALARSLTRLRVVKRRAQKSGHGAGNIGSN